MLIFNSSEVANWHIFSAGGICGIHFIGFMDAGGARSGKTLRKSYRNRASVSPTALCYEGSKEPDLPELT